MSFRLRLLLASLSTLAIGLGALLVLGNVLLARRADAETSTVLHADADAQVAALSIVRGHVVVRDAPNDATLDRRSWVLDGDRVLERPAGASARLDAAAIALGRHRRAVEVDGPGDARLRSEPVADPGSHAAVGSVVVAQSTQPLEQLRRGVLLGSLVLAALVLVAGGFAISGAVGGALRPVARMTANAEDWGAHDLDRRFDLGPPRDELTALAATLDLLLARIAASRRHEQHFASEVAHELRTPLAGLRLRAELALAAGSEGTAPAVEGGADVPPLPNSETGCGAGGSRPASGRTGRAAGDPSSILGGYSGRGPGGPPDPAVQDEREQALRAIVADAVRLDRVIDALLAVARQEIDPARGTVDLALIAREVDGVAVRLPAALPMAEGDPDVVRRALAPLVENARRHARERVLIELSAGGGVVRLAVRDDGPGLDPRLGERAFDPGVRGPGGARPHDGAGLGLALARRLARSCGGDVVIGDGPGGCFVLALPSLGPRDAAR